MEISSITAFEKSSVENLAFNMDCTHLAVSSHEGEIKVWKLGETGELQN